MKITLPNTTVERPPVSFGANNVINNTPHYFTAVKTDCFGSCVLTAMNHDPRLLITSPHSYARSTRSNRQLSRSTSRASGKLQPNPAWSKHKQPSSHVASNNRHHTSLNPIRLDCIFNLGILIPFSPQTSCQCSKSNILTGWSMHQMKKRLESEQLKKFEITSKISFRSRSSKRNKSRCGDCCCSANKPNITQALNPPVQEHFTFFKE